MTNRRISRQVTDKLWADLDDGLIDPFKFASACLNWMSEDEVREMAEENGFLDEDEDEEEDEEEETEEEDEDTDEEEVWQP